MHYVCVCVCDVFRLAISTTLQQTPILSLSLSHSLGYVAIVVVREAVNQ